MQRHLVLTTTLGTLLGLSCTRFEKNEEHCFYNLGDATCRARYEDERPYCGADCVMSPDKDGCVAEIPTEPMCYSPCGNEQYAEENSNCEVADTGTGSMSEGPSSASMSVGTLDESDTSVGPGPSTETGPNGCEDHDACTDAAAPFCMDGTCVGCNDTPAPDEACASASTQAPVCFEGACVACTAESPGACGGITPICDPDTLSCKACSFHFECPASACNALTGACLDAEPATVGPGQTHTTLAAALASVAAGEEAVFVVRNNGTDPYFGSLATLGGGRVVALLADDGHRPRVTGDGSPTFSVDGATLLIEGLDIRGNTSGLGVRVSNGALVLDRTEVVENNTGGIALLAGSDALVRNTLVGGDRSDAHALDVRASSVDVLYTTLATGFGDGSALFCNAQASVDVRNSTLLNRDSVTPEVQCSGATITHSATETEVTNLNTTWFAGWGSGDLRLSATGGAVFAGMAQWETGDPPWDIDLTPRPNTDGASDYVGAHIP